MSIHEWSCQHKNLRAPTIREVVTPWHGKTRGKIESRIRAALASVASRTHLNREKDDTCADFGISHRVISFFVMKRAW